MKIHIPNSAFLGNFEAFLDTFDPTHKESLSITTNDRWMAMHPVVLAMIASLGQEAKNTTIDEVLARSGHYLTVMKLYDFLRMEDKKNIAEHEPSGRYIPLNNLSNSEDLTKFLTDMIPLLHLPKEPAQTIRYIVSELVRNVLEHSLASTGAFVCAQYYKKSNTIRIGIVDRGIGIKQSMTPFYHPASSKDALLLALTPGVTGVTNREGGNETNAGAGLFFVKSIAKINQTPFLLYSGDSLYKLRKNRTNKIYANPLQDNHSLKEGLPFWQGTVVGIDISLDKTTEFMYLLKAIRQIFATAIKERKRERFKKARFI